MADDPAYPDPILACAAGAARGQASRPGGHPGAPDQRLAAIHYIWMVKADISQPLGYFGMVVLLPGYRAAMALRAIGPVIAKSFYIAMQYIAWRGCVWRQERRLRPAPAHAFVQSICIPFCVPVSK